jgi:hypothetical protein
LAEISGSDPYPSSSVTSGPGSSQGSAHDRPRAQQIAPLARSWCPRAALPRRSSRREDPTGDRQRSRRSTHVLLGHPSSREYPGASFHRVQDAHLRVARAARTSWHTDSTAVSARSDPGGRRWFDTSREQAAG